MQARARDLEISGTRPHRAGRDPWTVALNVTAATDDITVTLLGLTVVDEVVRVSGIMRLLRRSDLRLSNVPALVLTTRNGVPLDLLRAHALPNGAMFWVSWIYGRPAEVCTGYKGHIEHIDLALGAGNGVRMAAVPGPWIFTFSVPDGSAPVGGSHLDDSVGEA